MMVQLTVTPLHDLESSHEEADSRLIRHAIDMSMYPRVVV